MTLIELVVVITITGIIAVVLGQFIVQPIQGYQSIVRRAELVDAAEMALRRTARDIRQALPNSVRIRDALGNTGSVTCNAAGQICTLEILNTLDGVRYREGPGTNPGGHDHSNQQFRLRINAADTDGFNSVGFFRHVPTPFTSTTERLAVYNQGAPPAIPCSGTGADAYSDAGCAVNSRVVMTNPNVVRFTIGDDGGGDEHRVVPVPQVVGGSFFFRWGSPNQRVFIVDTPVSYVCNAGPNGSIMRYAGYPITAAQQVTPAGGPGPALLTTPVSACTFSYLPGTSQRAGLVTLDFTIRDNASGEQVRLLHQVHVDNSP